MKHTALISSLIAASFSIIMPAAAQPDLFARQGLATTNILQVQYVSQRYKIGDRLRDDESYQILDNWWEFGLPDPKNDELYLRIAQEIFRVNSNTFKVLEIWQAVRINSN